MHRIAPLLAWRYIRGNKQEKTLSTMALVCFLGIFIGAFSLALVTCIMSGFEKATHEKLRSIHPQIIIKSAQGSLNYERITHVITTEFSSAVAALAPSNTQQILLHDERHEQTMVMMLRAIDAADENNLQSLSKKILSSNETVAQQLAGDSLIIGKKLGEQLQLGVGNSIELWIPDAAGSKRGSVALTSQRAIITGFFNTGIEEFDTGLVLCSFDYFYTLFPGEGISQIHVRLTDDADERATIAALQQRLHLDVYSWKDLYPALVSALKLEKYVMFIILALITLVASMNIVSLLFMYISYKRGDIALLKSLGTSNAVICRLFFMIGTTISGVACIAGLLAAYGAGLLLERFPFITLPDTYYVSHLPISLDSSSFILVFLVIMIISCTASIVSARTSVHLPIARILKGDT